MAWTMRPYLPLWQRGQPGFKVDPLPFRQWTWRFLDFNGHEIERATIEFSSESDALDHAAETWRANKRVLQARADRRQAAFGKGKVAPEV